MASELKRRSGSRSRWLPLALTLAVTLWGTALPGAAQAQPSAEAVAPNASSSASSTASAAATPAGASATSPTKDNHAGASADSAAATALYEQALRLLEKGTVAEACEKLKASHALDAGVGTSLRLGDCYERLRRFASARYYFEQAEQLARSRGDSRRARIAAVRSAALGPRIPRLQVRLASAGAKPPAGLRVTVNGLELAPARLGETQNYDAGRYRVRATAPGRVSFASSVTLANDDPQIRVVTIPPLARLATPALGAAGQPNAPPRPSVKSLQRRAKRRQFGWIVAGAGGAALVGSGVFALLARQRSQESDDQCAPGNSQSCNPEGVDLRDEALNLAQVATALSIGGAVALGGGLTLVLSSAPPSDPVTTDSAFWARLEGEF